ncbi:MAG TPA: APC family permease [Gemmatimonadaceae bacterium]|nr:APC family permease [Gemmatimonadaceae bacterium]
MTQLAEASEPESAPVARPARSLFAVLGVAFGLSVIIGNTVGSGILRTPGEIARQLPTVPLFLGVWIMGAAYAALGANTLAELGTMMPQSGGFTVFVRRAMGPYAGFVIGWSDWLSTCSSIALAAIVLGEYTGLLFGWPKGLAPMIGSGVIVGFALLQWIGVKSGSRAQTITAFAKTAAFVVLIVACFVWGRGITVQVNDAARTAAPNGFALVTALVLSMQAVIFTYDGYYAITYFSGEVRNPGREIPRSIFGGVIAVGLLYVLVNLAFLYVLPLSRMAGDPLVAGSAAREVFGTKGDTVLRSIMIISLLSAVNAFQLMASRVLYRLGALGFMRSAEYVNRGGTPSIGLLLSSIVAVALVITGTFELVLAITAFFFVADYALAFVSLLILRRKEPETPRPYRAKGHPWTTGGVFVLSVVFLIGAVATDTRNSVYSLGLLALSWPVYLLMKPTTKNPNSVPLT